MITIEKHEGETLAELLTRMREEYVIADDVPCTYAGRLDPMASGAVLVLVGEEVHHKDMYMKLDKEYSFDVMFGVTTDTLDVLGIVQAHQEYECDAEQVQRVADIFKGVHTQEYPAYSSKPINGTPSFVHARAGTPVQRPIHDVALHSVVVDSVRSMTIKDCARQACERIARVSGDFRQQQCMQSWHDIGETHPHIRVVCTSMRARVGSGFYVRVFAEELGKGLGVPACAWRIHRERIIMPA